ncbi:MAG TPA: glyoxalase, partial [Psychrobacter sp.]|nr:glyoxalase [Psychrobacter sp.]
DAIKHDMLDEWSRTKRAPVHTQFLHSDEFAEARDIAPVGE